jgi:RNA polymerase subunit RPABC4/transcription elongation factor Spt4
MPDNEQLRQEQARQAAQAERAAQAAASALCKHCGAALEPDSPFCPNCGERAGGEERTCEFCQTKTSKEFCPHCGRRVIPLNCPTCGTPSIYDACENCGTILNPAIEQALSQEIKAPEQMSAELVEQLEAEFNALDSGTSVEFKAFQKKLIERQILLEERDYFNKREKRIIKAFGSRPFTLELPDPEEEAFRMKAYAALEKTVLEKQEKAIQAELERLFPPLPPAEEAHLSGEFEKNRKELERKYNEILAKIGNEVDAFHKEEERKRLEEEKRRLEEERRRIEEERRRQEAERQRREAERRRQEAERQRQMELERQRLEQERYNNRFLGSYSNGDQLTLRFETRTKASARDFYKDRNARSYVQYRVSFDGTSIYLEQTAISGYSHVRPLFSGMVNETGTSISGNWISRDGTQGAYMTYYKC